MATRQPDLPRFSASLKAHMMLNTRTPKQSVPSGATMPTTIRPAKDTCTSHVSRAQKDPRPLFCLGFLVVIVVCIDDSWPKGRGLARNTLAMAAS